MRRAALRLWCRLGGPARLGKLLKRSSLDRPLAFMHVPKTAGSALVVGLREILPSTPYVGGYDRSMFGALCDLDVLDPVTRDLVCSGTLAQAGGADLVAGHFALTTLMGSRPGARLMTVLREPRSRLLSLWMHWRSTWGQRQPLAEFLAYPEAGYQTDNVVARMLLWPHPLIPDGAFIEDSSDARLIGEACARLGGFDFTDIVENPALEANLRSWLARPFAFARVNETPRMPANLRGELRDELSADTYALLDQRSRLDRVLWATLVRERMPEASVDALAEAAFRETAAKHARLMAA